MLRHRPEAMVLIGGEHSAATRAALKRSRVLVAETWDLPAEPLGVVAGFGDFEGAGSCFPALTTVQVGPHGIGRHTAALLLDTMAGGPAGRLALPVRIVQRAST